MVSLLRERADDELNRRFPGHLLVHGLWMRVPVPVHGPEDEGLEHDAGCDGGYVEGTDSPATDPLLEIAGEESKGAVPAGAVPKLRELRVVESAAVEERDPDPVAGQHVVELAQNGCQLGAHVSDPRARERRREGRKR